MLQAKMKAVTRKTKSTSVNTYGEIIESFTSVGNVNMVISLSGRSEVESNDMRIKQCTHIGLTNDVIAVGDLIADKYEIIFINNAGHMKEVYMKEVESNGSFN